MVKWMLFGALIVVGATSNGQECSSAECYARQMSRTRVFVHDRTYVGRENIYWSSRPNATPADAVRAWMKSPGHRANMPFIRDIRCVNGFCVGR